jgi:hypothetical protein
VSDYRASTTRGIGTTKITEEEDKIYNENIDQQDMSNRYYSMYVISRRYSSSSGFRKWMENMNR